MTTDFSKFRFCVDDFTFDLTVLVDGPPTLMFSTIRTQRPVTVWSPTLTTLWERNRVIKSDFLKYFHTIHVFPSAYSHIFTKGRGFRRPGCRWELWSFWFSTNETITLQERRGFNCSIQSVEGKMSYVMNGMNNYISSVFYRISSRVPL